MEQIERMAWKPICYHMSNGWQVGICCVIQEAQPRALDNLKVGDREGNGSGVQEGGGMCIPVVDSGGYYGRN